MKALLVIVAVLSLPTVAQAKLDPGPLASTAVSEAKPFCLGINTNPWKPYDGKCRYGAPLGPMQFMAAKMKRTSLTQRLGQTQLPDRFQVRLLDQVNDIGYAEPEEGQGKVEGNAKKARRSWARRASVNCLMIGAATAGITAIIHAAFHKGDPDLGGALEVGTGACVAAVTYPKIENWTKGHGYDLED